MAAAAVMSIIPGPVAIRPVTLGPVPAVTLVAVALTKLG